MDESGGGSHRCVRILYFTWKIFTCLFTHVMLVTLVVGYCMLGAFTFSHLESGNELIVKQNVVYIRGNLTEALWTYTQEQPMFVQENWTIFAMKKLKVFENDLVLAMRKAGWDGTEENVVHQWTMTGALFYSIIVITTIGYGHIAPKTYLGKVTTIFYAIVGIPLMLLCLSNIGDIMAHSFRFMYWRVCCYSCTKAEEAQSRQSSRRSYRRSYGYERNGPRDMTPVSSYSMRSSAGPRQLYHRDLEEWEMVYEEELRMNRDRGRRAGSEITRGRYQRTRHLEPQNAVPEPVQQSVLYNKYAIDDDINKDSAWRVAEALLVHAFAAGSIVFSPPTRGQFPIRKDEADNEVLAAKQRNLGNIGKRSQEHLNTSPRIMSPMGFLVGPRQNQPKMRDYYDYSEDSIANPIKPVPIWLCVFLVVSYIVGGAVLFSGWEDWGYADSAYFCFITLTTIGFGDFVPAQRVNNTNGQISIALCSLYLLFGIALLAMSFNLVQEEVIANVKAVARHLGIIKDDGEVID